MALNYWVISYTSMTILSLIGQFVIIYFYIKLKNSNTSNTSQALMLRMAISDIFFCIAQLIIIYPDENNIKTRCDIQSILQQFSALSLCSNCFCLSYFSYLSYDYYEGVIEKYVLYSVTPCFLIPLILAFITNLLGESSSGEYTCYIAGVYIGSGAIELFTTFYIPLIILMSLSLFYVGKSMYRIRLLKKYHGESLGSLIFIFLERKSAEEILMKMMFYPVVFLISWLGFIIERILYLITENQNQFKYEGLLVLLNDSQGFLNASIYLINYYRTKQIVEEHFLKNKMKTTTSISSNNNIESQL